MAPARPPDSSSSNEPLTKDGAIVGTLAYMAPEQLRGHDVDARSDVFSFGAVLYEMLSGARAFDGSSNADIIAAVLERQPPSLAERNPLTPRAVDRLVSTCLAKDPNDRWQSSRDLQRELRWLLEDKTLARRSAGTRASRAIVVDVTFGRRSGDSSRRWRPRCICCPLSRQTATPAAHHIPGAGAGRQHFFARHGATVGVAGWQHAGVRRADRTTAPGDSGFAGSAISSRGCSTKRSTRCFRSGHLTADRSASLPQTSSSGSMSMVAGGANCRTVLIPRGGAWNRDGTILFGSNFVLQRVPDTGGVPTPVTSLDDIAYRTRALVASVST